MAQGEASVPKTSVDVARRAGVSQAAVSLVFGGKAAGRVSKQTEAAILAAAHELDYHPNIAARTLRSGRSHLVVLAVPDVSNPFFAAVLQGAEQAARQYGYTVMLASVRDERDWQQVVLDALAARSVAGFIFFDALASQSKERSADATIPHPIEKAQQALQSKAVLVDASSSMLPGLCLDVAAGMHAAMTHLLGLGHTKIAHLAAAVDLETFHLRHEAYREALQSAGLPVVAAHEQQTFFTIADAQQAAHCLLEDSDPPSAIVCDSDVLAVGVYKAAKALHRAIPQDLSVVSFDDSLIARLLDPELTTVAIPTTTIGEQAFLLLSSVLENEPASAQTIVPLELVIRASTASLREVQK